MYTLTPTLFSLCPGEQVVRMRRMNAGVEVDNDNKYASCCNAGMRNTSKVTGYSKCICKTLGVRFTIKK